ncbi:o-succinylbenzoate synthase [Natronogracilivirga saccharolytica]|uniref:o-succinylbenzoate synthase n=1 Tax=Natronogracilivirga saccharolytica TaxID=2812953 RepID=A0A8J7RLK3_9BACT|nr:o-succinylbenzoate synthase [Natronogracilivirga saccharolytica]MBP3193095.1 o-succinylbenzoate synthase [Natronogracilivirga saccharolytica]
MSKLCLFSYRIPFRKPFQNAAGVINYREGFIMGDGNRIWTEIAPLPGFSSDNLQDAWAFLKNNHPAIQDHFNNRTLSRYLREKNTSTGLKKLPSVAFGLSLLHEQQAACDRKMSLFQHWTGEKTDSGIKCNAVCGLSDLPDVLSQIYEFSSNGYETIKLKIPGDAAEAESYILNICDKFPGVTFRFDANAMLSRTDTHKLLQKLGKHLAGGALDNLEYIEEPIKWKKLQDIHDLKTYGIAIAADESVRSAEAIRKIAKSGAFDAFVIKPMIAGPFDELKMIWQNSTTTVISSSLETAIGRQLLANLSLYLNHFRNNTHGLATGHMLASDLGSNLMPDRPEISIPDLPGAGFSGIVTLEEQNSETIKIERIL